MDNKEPLTQLLNAWSGGSVSTGMKIKGIIYQHTKQLIRNLKEERKQKSAQYQQGSTANLNEQLPNTTSFLHDVLLYLVPPKEHIEKRQQFYSQLAQFIRWMLVDEICRLGNQKNGGNAEFTSLTELIVPDSAEALLKFDQALTRLQQVPGMAGQVIEWRYFAGLSVDQIVEEFHISKHDVYQELKAGKAFIRTQLEVSGT